MDTAKRRREREEIECQETVEKKEGNWIATKTTAMRIIIIGIHLCTYNVKRKKKQKRERDSDIFLCLHSLWSADTRLRCA